MSVVSDATSRCWTWSTISMCWSASREPWQDRVRCSSGGNGGDGRRVSTGFGTVYRRKHSKDAEVLRLTARGASADNSGGAAERPD